MLLFQAVKPALLEWCVEWLLYVILSSIKLIQRNAQPWWNFIRISFTKWEPYGLLLLIEHWVGSSSRTKSWTDTNQAFYRESASATAAGEEGTGTAAHHRPLRALWPNRLLRSLPPPLRGWFPVLQADQGAGIHCKESKDVMAIASTDKHLLPKTFVNTFHFILRSLCNHFFWHDSKRNKNSAYAQIKKRYI